MATLASWEGETMAEAHLYLGTSSWHFDAWRGVFYPENASRSDYLAYYATQFNSVEVNTSFYGLPRAATVAAWLESVPPGFTFSLKFPRSISHERQLEGADEETRAFLDLLRELGPAAGVGLLQLPPQFTRARLGRRLATYLEWLAAVAEGLRIAVEVRARDLMTPAFARFLAQRGLALALTDWAGTPDLFDLWEAARLEAGEDAPGFALIRWIGDQRNGPRGDRERSAPREEDLARWAGRVHQLYQAGITVFGYMHNPYEGHSPASVRRLQALLAERMALPPWPPQPPPPVQGSLGF
uniref:DUF72 domain-containing protein n=2 Tax=Litorilinea aerophila TaxID=1204385 RepID=A0A540VKU9_9CHLR